MLQGYSVNKYKSTIGTHIILVRIVRSYQNYCIKYATQNQNFDKNYAYSSDNTNYSFNSYTFIVLI
jgi:hypothetical protein